MNLPSKESRIRHKIETVLNVQRMLHAFLLPMKHEGWGPNATDLDTECRTSAEATFINSCNQLDTFLQQLGDTTTEKAIDDALLKALETGAKAHESQVLTSLHLRRPCVLFHAQLTKTSDNRWACFVGDLMDVDACVIGVGESPDEASNDFDRLWFELRDPNKAPAAAPEPEPEQKPKRKGRKK